MDMDIGMDMDMDIGMDITNHSFYRCAIALSLYDPIQCRLGTYPFILSICNYTTIIQIKKIKN